RMPRIPEYVAQQGAIDIGQAPSANNGGQAVGARLQALGSGLQQAGDDALAIYRRQQEIQGQKARFQTSTNLEGTDADLKVAYDQYKQQAPATGDGFHDG